MASKKQPFQIHQSPANTQRTDDFKQLMLDYLADGEKRGFNDIFLGILDGVKTLYPSKGEELMRLQAYELLQGLVARGQVERQQREYWRTVAVEAATTEGGEA